MTKKENLWQQAVGLTYRVFQLTGGLNLPRGNYWSAVVAVGLSQANEKLDSIHTLLDKGYCDSSVILARSIFELAVNLAYISKDTKTRLPQYLRHGRIPLTPKETQQLNQELEQKLRQAVRDVVPKQSWKGLKDMCRELGSPWLEEYETFYRYSSVPTHAGSFTLGENYKQLLQQQPASEHQKATVLITSLEFHLRIAEVAALTFPEQIKVETVKEMRVECQKLGQSLVKG